MIKYHLSNRQAKELTNGKVLRIALPWPDAGIPGAHRHHDTTGHADMGVVEAWYRATLDSQDHGYAIAWLGVTEVPVDPLNRPEGGLSSVFGTIVNAGRENPPALVVRVVCVIAEIAARQRPRATYPTQWPGRLTTDKLSLP